MLNLSCQIAHVVSAIASMKANTNRILSEKGITLMSRRKREGLSVRPNNQHKPLSINLPFEAAEAAVAPQAVQRRRDKDRVIS